MRGRDQGLDCVFLQRGIFSWNSLLQDSSKDRNSTVLVKLAGLFIMKMYTSTIFRSFKSIRFNQRVLKVC